MKLRKISPKIIYCHDQREFAYYMRPFAYSPDKSNLLGLGGVRCQCPACGFLHVYPRFNFEMDGGATCPRCYTFMKGYFIPDGMNSYKITPIEIRHIGKN